MRRSRIIEHGASRKGIHIDGRTERSRTVGRSTYTTLYINAVQAWRHIRHIDPEHSLTLRIIERHIVHSHIDTGMVRTTYAEIGVPDS